MPDETKDENATGDDQKITLKIEGDERTVTLAELKAIAQKNLAADVRLQSASELLEENKRMVEQNKAALNRDALFQKARQGDQDALRNLMIEFGNPPEQVDEYIRVFNEQLQGGDDDDGESDEGDKKPVTKHRAPAQPQYNGPPIDPTMISELNEFVKTLNQKGIKPKDVAAEIGAATDRAREQYLASQVKGAIKGSDFLKKIVAAGGDEEALTSLASSVLAGRLSREGRQLASGDVEKAIHETAELLKRGSSPQLPTLMSVGDLGDLGMVGHPEAPEKRPPITSREAEAYATHRIAEIHRNLQAANPGQ